MDAIVFAVNFSNIYTLLFTGEGEQKFLGEPAQLTFNV